MGWPDAFAAVGVAFAFAWIVVALFRAIAESNAAMFRSTRHDYELSETTDNTTEDE